MVAFDFKDTIAAIATPPGNGGVGIVRITGSLVAEIAEHLLSKPLTPRLAQYTPFFDADRTIIDSGIALYFPGPASYTGEDDPFIPATQVAAFRQEMDKAGVTYQAVTYPGAKHAFTNPEADKYGQEFKLPLAYNAAADKASWDEGLAFLADAFKGK